MLRHSTGGPQNSTEAARARVRWTALAAGAVLCAGLAGLLVGAALGKPLDHDEQMYVAAAALLRRGTGLPYRDFPFLQGPGLPLAYAALFLGTGRLLLAARLLNTLAAVAGLGALGALVWRACGSAGYLARVPAAVGVILLVVGNGPFTYTSGRAWNHDLPVLLALLGLARFAGARSPRGQLAAGVLLGLAAATRLAFAPALLPFLLLATLAPAGSTAAAGAPVDLAARLRARLRPAAAFAGGVLLGLAPALLLAALAPGRFLFDNFAYHALNTTYSTTIGRTVAMSLPGKLAYMQEILREQPGCLALLVLYALVALPALAWAAARGRLREQIALALAATLVPCLLLGALVPTPSLYQYFYAPVPFMALATGLGLAALGRAGAGQGHARWAAGLGALWLGAAVALSGAAPDYADDLAAGGLGDLAASVPIQVHDTGLAIRRLVDAQSPGGAPARVLTLAPLYALEGGLDPYPALATGPFTWRVAPLLDPAQRAALGIVGAGDLPALVGADPPAAVLSGAEGALEDPLIAYAQGRGYRPVRLAGGLTLWLR